MSISYNDLIGGRGGEVRPEVAVLCEKRGHYVGGFDRLGTDPHALGEVQLPNPKLAKFENLVQFILGDFKGHYVEHDKI